MVEKQVEHKLKYALQIGPRLVPAGEKVDLWPDQLKRIRAMEARRQADEADQPVTAAEKEG